MGIFPRAKSLFVAVWILASQTAVWGQNDSSTKVDPENPLKNAPIGLAVNKPNAWQGFTLVSPLNSKGTFLIDMEGRVVHQWKSDYTPALCGYLLENGNLFRPGAERGFVGPGAGGRIQEFTWDGDLVWDYSFGDSKQRPHHDICRMPNGNVLVIVTDPKTHEEAVAAGRKNESIGAQLLPDSIYEIKRTGPTTGEIIWKWHAWDHLVQDTDKSLPNYGDVSEHPELIDVNFSTAAMERMMQDPQQLAKLRALGYVGGGNAPKDPNAKEGDANKDGAAKAEPNDTNAKDAPKPDSPPPPPNPFEGDWMHTNSIVYNAKLDQIMLSIHEFHEVWIIDHSTTTAEAASHKGGRSGKGGDLLYRWGNPRAYRNGTNADQRLFGQHYAHWIEEGKPGAGHMLVFNNGPGRPDGEYSSIDEIVLPLNEKGTYDREEFTPFGPDKATWSFVASEKKTFYSSFISGAHRLENGNTMVCSGASALLFEVTPNGEIVWQYKHPGGEGPGGPGGPGGPPRPGELVPGFLGFVLQISPPQWEEIKKLQDEIDPQIDKLLSDEQKEKRKSVAFPLGPPGGPPPGPPGGGNADRPPTPPPAFKPPRVGEAIPSFVVDRLDLNESQKSQLEGIQKQIDERLGSIWTDEQKTKMKEMEEAFAKGPGFGPPPFPIGPPPGVPGPGSPPGGPPGVGGPPGGPPGPPGGPPGPPGRGGPPRGPGGIFRVYRYGSQYAAFKGRKLESGERFEDIGKREMEEANAPPPAAPNSEKSDDTADSKK